MGRCVTDVTKGERRDAPILLAIAGAYSRSTGLGTTLQWVELALLVTAPAHSAGPTLSAGRCLENDFAAHAAGF